MIIRIPWLQANSVLSSSRITTWLISSRSLIANVSLRGLSMPRELALTGSLWSLTTSQNTPRPNCLKLWANKLLSLPGFQQQLGRMDRVIQKEILEVNNFIFIGLGLKFYTEEGNWDFVGNSTPVFWLKDPIKFADLTHSRKRDPRSGLKNPNYVWDFISHHW